MKFSIITVNYNNRAGLEKTIESVLGQTCKDYEYIIIDGGSTDGSREVIERVQDRLAYWCSEPDKGIYNAMNKGIAKAKGEYLNFMNSGDYFYDKDVLEKLFREGLHADMISGRVESMPDRIPLHPYEDSVLMQIYLDTLNHQGTFIRRQLLLHRPYDESLRIVSDWKFWLEAVLYDGASVVYSQVLVAKMDSTGISSNGAKVKEERRACLELLSPALIQVLEDYQQLRNWIEVKRMLFLKRELPILYWVCHYMITSCTKTSALFTRKRLP